MKHRDHLSNVYGSRGHSSQSRGFLYNTVFAAIGVDTWIGHGGAADRPSRKAATSRSLEGTVWVCPGP